MCATCGCDEPDHDHGHRHEHGHEHEHEHEPAGVGRTVVLRQRVLARNDDLAQDNRAWLAARGVLAVNLMSSPGAGKTTLLERTVRELGPGIPVCVVEGDQETALDADRIEAAGAAVVQINTGSGCHLDASAVGKALARLDPAPGSVVLIENVGNLVCPALFDLGERARVVIASVTEGADKPRKYPRMFAAADLVLLNKTDLLPYLQFDAGGYAADLALVSPRARLLPLTATSGDGVGAWLDWLREHALGG